MIVLLEIKQFPYYGMLLSLVREIISALRALFFDIFMINGELVFFVL